MAKKQADVTYVTSQPGTVLFDILVKGENIRGVWADITDKSTVLFHVPAELAEPFERHYHFLSGNVVRFMAAPEPINEVRVEVDAETAK